jgi:NADH dehydrogenase FAD-containing subunit
MCTKINRKATFLEGTATDVDVVNRRLVCESVVCDGNSCDIDEFIVDYDRLVVTIGAQTNTFGIPGVREHCNFLKQVEDARRIRNAIVNCFERANLPGMSEEERINNLTFAVIGAGPTGIEFAAELRDFVEQDSFKYYPNLLSYVRIKVIEASSTVLAPFDKSLQEEAISQMMRQVQIKDPEVQKLLPERFQLVELLLESSVKEVTEKTIVLNDGSSINYGLSVWAAGNGPLPLTLQIVEKLGQEQAAEQNVGRGRIVTDAWMRAKGSGGRIMAYGDCSCTTNGPDGPLPATGQVAAQQGEFVAKLMNKGYNLTSIFNPEGIELPPTRRPEHQLSVSDSIAAFTTRNREYAKPFQFLNLGILAYTGGGSALAQVATAPNAQPIKQTGKIGNALWKSVYISKQVSWRNRFMVVNDWLRRQIFGRDITRL